MTYLGLVSPSNFKKDLKSLNGLVMDLMKAIVIDRQESELDVLILRLMTSTYHTLFLRNMETKQDFVGLL